MQLECPTSAGLMYSDSGGDGPAGGSQLHRPVPAGDRHPRRRVPHRTGPAASRAGPQRPSPLRRPVQTAGSRGPVRGLDRSAAPQPQPQGPPRPTLATALYFLVRTPSPLCTALPSAVAHAVAILENPWGFSGQHERDTIAPARPSAGHELRPSPEPPDHERPRRCQIRQGRRQHDEQALQRR